MKLGVNDTTALHLYHHVHKASGIEDLMEMLQHPNSSPRKGAPRLIEAGSKESLQIREDVLKLGNHQRTDAANHTRPKGEKLSKSVVCRVVYDKLHCEADPHCLRKDASIRPTSNSDSLM